MDEVLQRGTHRWLLVADKVLAVLSQPNGWEFGSVGFIAAAIGASADH